MTSPDKSASNEQDSPAALPASRKAYSTPILTVFGSVTTLTHAGSTGSPEATPPAPVNGTKTSRKASDVRLKENIRRIGQHPLGFGLYLFDYRPQHQHACGYGRQFGVMAQEVETVIPSAVHATESGYKAVDYQMLGIHCTRH